MNKPPKLVPGSRIGVCAPSSRLNEDHFEAGCRLLRTQGFDVFVHPQCHEQDGQIAGSADVRAAALQSLLLDPSVDSVIFTGGGHRAAEIIPLLDWAKLKNIAPKIVMGYSDNTVLLHSLNARLNWVTFYGPTVQAIGRTKDTEPDTWTRSLAVLNGGTPSYTLRYSGPAVTGKIVAATLSMLPLILDTADMPDLTNAILCIEDLHEEFSTIDRLLLLLRRKGVFDRISALVCGQFLHLTDSGRPFGFDLEQIVRHHAGRTPVGFDAPFGHGDFLYALPVGVKAGLSADTLTLLDPAVS